MQGPRLSSHSQSESIPNFNLLAPRKSLETIQNDVSNEVPITESDYLKEGEKIGSNGSENGGNGGDEPPILKQSKLFNLKRIVLKQLGFLGPGMVAAVAYGK